VRALQAKSSELEERCAALSKQLNDSGLAPEEPGQEEADADELCEACFGSVTRSSWCKPPAGWPAELHFTNQTLWGEVPKNLQFFRHKIADPSAVKRPHHFHIIKIKDKKHPCCGEYGLFAAEPIPKDAALFDYAGHVQVVVGDDKDTSRSSYLLNLFTHDGSVSGGKTVHIDIDAAKAGNEARFLNDFHGTGKTPNAQFFHYVDQNTGEKRISVKTLRAINTDAEILVDYGHRYFTKGSDEDSDEASSDEDFLPGSHKKQSKRTKVARKKKTIKN